MKAILLRYGELFLKGNNRGQFEKLLIKDIKEKLKGIPYVFERSSGRYVITNFNEVTLDKIIDRLKHVFGLVSLSVSEEILSSVEEIKAEISKIKTDKKTFRVTVNRADKRFPIKSPDFAAELGGLILAKNPHLKVKLIKPEFEVMVDIRENGKAYIYTEVISCAGGLPHASSGRGLMLLSGGIDSPVAGYLMAKRGMRLNAIHFHSYPYTSLEAKEKVLDLAKILKSYTGGFDLYMVPFTEIQEEIHKCCLPEFMITIMRRIMMRISERVATQNKMGAIITGESLGQVASQTMESMTVTGGVVEKLPIFRPLIGFDKEDIMNIAEKIGTYETSILPYEDCCTVFLPKNPIIKPKIEEVLIEEAKLDISVLIDRAITNIEIIRI